jgi:hypothetical protein
MPEHLPRNTADYAHAPRTLLRLLMLLLLLLLLLLLPA